MEDLKKYKIEGLPSSAYYVPHFITSDEESMIMKMIYNAPKPKWKTLSNRRLQNWGGLPHPKGMIQEKLPVWLLDCVKKVENLKIFHNKEPNHVLINEYLSGQGIMPHEDGPLFYPTIATVNVGSHTVLDYYEKSLQPVDSETCKSINNKYIGSVLLEKCSLLVVQEDLYSKYLHGICERKIDTINDNIKNLHQCDIKNESELTRNTRLSLTIRFVPHTIKAKFLFGIR